MSKFFTYSNDKGKTDVFNMDFVVRAVSDDNKDTLTVILDDFHEELAPASVPKGKGYEVQMRKQSICSFIELNEEDTKRFIEACKA